MSVPLPAFSVPIEKSHYREPLNYFSTRDCPLARALQEMCPGNEVKVGGHMCSIGSREYLILNAHAFMDAVSDRKPITVELEETGGKRLSA